jgi:DNA-binding MarR family transcriptional regulator
VSDNLFGQLAHSQSDPRMRAWFAIVSAFTHVERHLRQALAETFDLSLPRFDTLMALAQETDGVTMGDLAEQLMVTKGNVTGVVRRLEQDGLVRRTSPRHDKRVQVIRLTAKGKRLWGNFQTEYARVISEHLDTLPKAQADAIARALLTISDVPSP